MNRQHATTHLAALTARFASAFPQYFALVMASAIIATGARELGYNLVGWALFAATVLAYPLCWLAGATRLLLQPLTVLRETTHHREGPQFLTIVASTGLLGGLLGTFQVASWALPGLFAASVVLWIGFLYAFLAGVTEGRQKPPLETGITGAWLLVSVATSSLAISGSALMQHGNVRPPGLAFFCYVWVLVAILYYALLGAMVLYRFAFVPMPPEEIAGPWWINAGAATTTLLAGTKLMSLDGLQIGRYNAEGLLAPLMILLWADATFWIPLLILLFTWKYVIRRRKLHYAPALWSIVFPLGSYAAATLQCVTVYGLDFLYPVANGFFWIAFLAWMLGILGLLFTIGRSLVQARKPVPTN